MTAGGEAEDRHAMRIEVPSLRAGTHRSDRSGRSLEHGWMMMPRAQSVLMHKCRDPQRVEPLGDLLAFVIQS
jgi:hypothetical protein